MSPTVPPAAPHATPTAPQPPPRRRAALGLVVAAASAVLLTALVVGTDGAPGALDRALTTFTRGWADPLGWPVDAAHALGVLTAPVRSTILATLLVLVLVAVGFRAAGAYLALSAGLGVALTEITKRTVGRARPPGAAQFEPDLDRSFPSGHASAGIYLYLTLGLILLRIAGGAPGRRPPGALAGGPRRCPGRAGPDDRALAAGAGRALADRHPRRVGHRLVRVTGGGPGAVGRPAPGVDPHRPCAGGPTTGECGATSRDLGPFFTRRVGHTLAGPAWR